MFCLYSTIPSAEFVILRLFVGKWAFSKVNKKYINYSEWLQPLGYTQQWLLRVIIRGASLHRQHKNRNEEKIYMGAFCSLLHRKMFGLMYDDGDGNILNELAAQF